VQPVSQHTVAPESVSPQQLYVVYWELTSANDCHCVPELYPYSPRQQCGSEKVLDRA
jgi:hypothetical protein